MMHRNAVFMQNYGCNKGFVPKLKSIGYSANGGVHVLLLHNYDLPANLELFLLNYYGIIMSNPWYNLMIK